MKNNKHRSSSVLSEIKRLGEFYQEPSRVRTVVESTRLESALPTEAFENIVQGNHRDSVFTELNKPEEKTLGKSKASEELDRNTQKVSRRGTLATKSKQALVNVNLSEREHINYTAQAIAQGTTIEDEIAFFLKARFG